MRSSIRINYITIFFITFIVLFLNILIIIPRSIAQDQLNIHLTDNNGYPINEIFEEEYFIISVYVLNESGIPEWKIDTDIAFNNIHYTIDETGEITIQAPKVDQDTSYVITASIKGYNSTNVTLTILNHISQEELLKLIVEPEDYTVEASKQFSVLVKDEFGNIISDALVAIQNYGDTRNTDDDGRAWLTAPEDKKTITIIAQKEGYNVGKIVIKVNIPQYWWTTFLNSPYFPIVIAMIILLFAIIFVNYRQKKSIYNRANEISQEKTIKKFDDDGKTLSCSSDNKKKPENQSSFKEVVRIQPQQDVKVEEIRIRRSSKEKEIVPVESEDDEVNKIIDRKKIKRHNYDWFEGKDDIRYEIDKLTGKIDEEGLHKWYVGVDNLKDKIDEKVKNKDKKKNKEM